MKKLFFLLFGLLLLFACEQESVLPATSEMDETIEGREMKKMNVCHNANGKWKVINISANAWPSHRTHGDVQLIDADGDGYVVALNACVPGGDCNDQNAAINPGAEEVCGDSIDNDCDGQVDEGCFSYPTVVLNGKTWLAQNLDLYVPGASWCYDNNPNNCVTYGRLYTWEAAKTACAQLGNGWRLPTIDEWTAVINLYGGVGSNTSYNSLILGGSSGLDILLAGNRQVGSSDVFIYLDTQGNYWSSSLHNPVEPWYYNFVSSTGQIYLWAFSKDHAFSVRCLCD